MDINLPNAFSLVSQPNSNLIKQGEQMLAILKKSEEYPLSLINFMNNPAVSPEGKLRSAIELKLWCEHFKVTTSRSRQFRSFKDSSTPESLRMSNPTFSSPISTSNSKYQKP